jgi:hypothetical protein
MTTTHLRSPAVAVASVPTLSIIICSIDAAKFAAVCANYAANLRGHPYEIVGIHDAKSLAEGYTRGFQQARGSVLIFSHDDVEIVSPDLAGAIARATEALDVVGIAGTSKLVTAFWPQAGHPYLHGWITQPVSRTGQFAVSIFGISAPVQAGLQALDGVFFAAKRIVVERIGFDAATFDGFHGYDLDFSFAAHRAGFKVGTTAEVALIHASIGSFGETWRVYARRFAAKYGLPGDLPQPKWSFARVLVDSKGAITRDFPLSRLIDISRRLN